MAIKVRADLGWTQKSRTPSKSPMWVAELPYSRSTDSLVEELDEKRNLTQYSHGIHASLAMYHDTYCLKLS